MVAMWPLSVQLTSQCTVVDSVEVFRTCRLVCCKQSDKTLASVAAVNLQLILIIVVIIWCCLPVCQRWHWPCSSPPPPHDVASLHHQHPQHQQQQHQRSNSQTTLLLRRIAITVAPPVLNRRSALIFRDVDQTYRRKRARGKTDRYDQSDCVSERSYTTAIVLLVSLTALLPVNANRT